MLYFKDMFILYELKLPKCRWEVSVTVDIILVAGMFLWQLNVAILMSNTPKYLR